VTVVDFPARFTIGGSEAAAVLGCDPYLSPTMLAARKLGLVAAQEDNDAMRMGRALEYAHAELIAEQGVDILPAPKESAVHPSLDWWTARPDAYAEVLGMRAVVELKLHGMAPSDAVWLRDSLQVMHQLAATDLEVGLLSVLHGGRGGWQRTERVIERDDDLLAAMQERYEGFRDLLAQGEVPEPDGSNSTRDYFREKRLEWGETMRLDKDGWNHARAARFHTEREKWHAAEKERYWQAVQAQMGDATRAINAHDEPVAEWSESDYTRLDTAALKAARPDVYEEFSTTTTRRRFLPK
jgi:predicted phage-related endonuclease